MNATKLTKINHGMWFFLIVITPMIVFTPIYMDWFVLPILDGFNIVIPYVIDETDFLTSFLPSEQEMETMVDEFTNEVNAIDWEGMDDDAAVTLMRSIVADKTEPYQETFFNAIIYLFSPLVMLIPTTFFVFLVVFKIFNRIYKFAIKRLDRLEVEL